LIRGGVLRMEKPKNRTQERCGVFSVVLTEKWRED